MFIKELNDTVIKEIKQDYPPAFRRENVGWPSEALADQGSFPVGECRRSLFYKILGHPYTNHMSVRIKNICNAGIMYEKSAISKFKNMKSFLAEQVRVEFTMPNTQNKVTLSGKLDVLVKDGNTKNGVEIKTVYGYKAASIFGKKGKMPLPAANNLMQAMLYKYKTTHDKIQGHTIDNLYLMYINREDGCSIYFKIDIDQDGYPIIEPIDSTNKSHGAIRMADYPSFDSLNTRSITATSDECRYAELRININDIFKKFDETFSYAREGMLPPKDYILVYNKEQLDREYKCGKISKIKYNKHCKGTELIGDFKCQYCNYQRHCLEDSGITLTC